MFFFFFIYVFLFLYRFYDNTSLYGYIRIRTFLPDDIDSFLFKFGSGLQHLIKEIKITNLIIDVRGNGGGYIGLLSAVMDLLFGGKEMYFSDQEMQMVKSKDIISLFENFEDVCALVYYFIFIRHTNYLMGS
jgi:hypothetical protein